MRSRSAFVPTRSVPGHERRRIDLIDDAERDADPVADVAFERERRDVEEAEVPGEQHALGGEVHEDVAARVTGAELQEPRLVAADLHVDGVTIERHVGRTRRLYAVDFVLELRRVLLDGVEHAEAHALHLRRGARVGDDLRLRGEHRVAERVVDVMVRVEQPRDRARGETRRASSSSDCVIAGVKSASTTAVPSRPAMIPAFAMHMPPVACT